MENLFKELAWKAYQNGLSMDIYDHGSIDVMKFHTEINSERKCVIVSSGILKGFERWETPVAVLERMHQEVDEYIGRETADDMENVYFEQPHGVTSDELKMKEAGHKGSDFE